MKRPPIAVVKWIDAHRVSADLTIENVDRKAHHGWVTYSAGLVVKHDRNGITMCMDAQEPDRGDGSSLWNFPNEGHHIPRQMILRVTYLSGKPPKGAVRGAT